MPQSSAGERAALECFHGRGDESISAAEDDFLVLAMQAATGKPFTEIVARIWTTLNDGHPINSFALPETLPWPVRAYLVVCFLDRAYQHCPDALLREALTLRGMMAPDEYEHRLNQMSSSEGWRIFSVREQGTKLQRFGGRRIGCRHHLIAREAWRQRPVPAFDVADWVIQASIRSRMPYEVGRLADTLKQSADSNDERFATRLASAWGALDEAGVSGISLAALAAILSGTARNVVTDEAKLLIPALGVRAQRNDRESWIAAFQLWDLSSPDRQQKTFPEGIDLAGVIEVADFSLASTRANRFANALGRGSSHYAAYIGRLCKALEGTLDWELDPNALTWLLSRISVSDLTPLRLQRVREWLKQHPEDSFVRTKFLSIVEGLPPDSGLRDAVFNETAFWLKQHPEDHTVRTKFLSIVEARTAPRRHRRKLQVSEEFIDAVDTRLPKQPWEPAIHRRVASELGVSPGMVYSAIRVLILRGRRFQQRDGVICGTTRKVSTIYQDGTDEGAVRGPGAVEQQDQRTER
jgi:hypothetical protein